MIGDTYLIIGLVVLAVIALLFCFILKRLNKYIHTLILTIIFLLGLQLKLGTTFNIISLVLIIFCIYPSWYATFFGFFSLGAGDSIVSKVSKKINDSKDKIKEDAEDVDDGELPPK